MKQVTNPTYVHFFERTYLLAFTGNIDYPAHLKQMVLVKAPLKTKYDGKLEHLRIYYGDHSLN
jgi:hypothetical protein